MIYSFTCSPKIFFTLLEDVYVFETIELEFKVTEVRPEQPENAELPILVTLLGMETEVRPVQL